MLGTRTKQVNSYGRRGSRIVNVSDRRDRESANSSGSDADTLPPPRPLKRENAIIISPGKPRVCPRRLHGPCRSPRGSPLVQNRNKASRARDVATKQKWPKPESSTHARQPLTPLRPNGASSSGQPSPGIKVKAKGSTIKRARTSLKPHVPVIAVDIIVLDEEGNTLKQEHRLSHTEIQANRVHAVTGKGKRNTKTSLPSPPPIVISDNSDQEDTPEPAIKRSYRRPHPVVISSDESDPNDRGDTHKKPAVPLAKSHSRSKPLRVDVVIPTTPPRKSRVSRKSLRPPPPTLAPPRPAAPPTPSFRSNPAAVPSLLPSHIPLTKPRQLTPIRGSSSRSLFRRPPPTPSTPTEADLSLDLAQLDLSDTAEIDNLAPVQPDYLIPLLNECMQTSPYEFSAFIETFPFDPIVQSSAEDEDARFRKIGEASYSEVFGIGDVVLKIVPIRLEESTHPEMDEIPARSDAEDVLKEIVVTREIGEICDNFVKLLKTYVVRGRYPSLLLDLWDEYNERKGSESIRPDSFGLTQVYAIIILPNGGPDLESFAFKNVSRFGWHQACGIFWQVARALEQAERLVNFEHRDLHWGQILVKSIPVKKSRSKTTSRVPMDDTHFGVKVTIIDLGLSRMSAGDAQVSKVYWTPFDEEIFEGEGDYQYDIYRMMRNFICSAWKSFHPFTNVMWLHYLITKLLHEKRLKSPSNKGQSGGESRVVSPTGYGERDCYDCLVEMEGLLGDCIASAQKGQKARRKTVAPSSGPKSAKDVIAYGMRQGWI